MFDTIKAITTTGLWIFGFFFVTVIGITFVILLCTGMVQFLRGIARLIASVIRSIILAPGLVEMILSARKKSAAVSIKRT